MAEGGDNGDRISWEDLKLVRRFTELFHGRFSEREGVKLYRHCNKNLLEAVNFVFEAEAAELRNVIGQEEWRVVEARNNRDINEVQRNEIPAQVRQFGCEQCDHMWWRRVPSRKLVSKCKVCKQRFDAIPRENEWGWAKHSCDHCRNEFYGFAEMNGSPSPCYKCGNQSMPEEIIPPNGRRQRRTRNVHSCAAPNCHNRDPTAFGNVLIAKVCVHPKSLDKEVVNPSRPHVSTGSTVQTFLDQDDLSSFYEPSVVDINEESSNTSDDDTSD
ncbi:hypothetical protein CHS0354_000311 [Potamilus streckersoni]|uniref:Uncharacterized protein n=1 Tax=Potamilus streckersoni TaxID=2493646 RepID=A0AAE0SAK7_9BIVA|nr:hypothetical protein CHS0354_000311 [Potamilus streckersoni]